MTTRPETALAFINQFSQQHGHPPMPKEISQGLKANRKTVYDCLDILEAWHAISVTRGPGGYRRWQTMKVIRQ